MFKLNQSTELKTEIQSTLSFFYKGKMESNEPQIISCQFLQKIFPTKSCFYIVISGGGKVLRNSGFYQTQSPGDFVFLANSILDSKIDLHFICNSNTKLLKIDNIHIPQPLFEALKKIFFLMFSYKNIIKAYQENFKCEKAEEFLQTLSTSSYVRLYCHQSLNPEIFTSQKNILVLNGELIGKKGLENKKTIKTNEIIETRNYTELISKNAGEILIGDLIPYFKSKTQNKEKSLLKILEKNLNLPIEIMYRQKGFSTCGIEVLRSLLDFYSIDYNLSEIEKYLSDPSEGVSLDELRTIFKYYKLDFTPCENKTRLSEFSAPFITLSSHHYIAYIPLKKSKWMRVDPSGISEILSSKYELKPQPDFISLVYKTDFNKKENLKKEKDKFYLSEFTKKIINTVLLNNKSRLINLIFLTITGAISGLIPILLIQYIIDYGLDKDNLFLLFGLSAAGILFSLSYSFVAYVKERILITFSKDFDFALMSKLTRKILSFDISLFNDKNIGDYQVRYQSIMTIRNFFSGSLLNSIFDILTLIVFGTFLIWKSIYLGILILFMLPGLYWVIRYYEKSMHPVIAKYFQYQKLEKDRIIETLHRFLTIKGLKAEDYNYQKLDKILSESARQEAEVGKLRAKTASLLEVLEGSFMWLGYGASLYLGAIGKISFGESTACIILISRVTSPVKNLSLVARDIIEVKWALHLIDDILAKNVKDFKDEANEAKVIQSIETFEVKKLKFKYPGQKNRLLENINISLKNGESLALVGLNGSGKSTLMKILAGLIKPNDFEVFINKNPVDDNDLRHNSTYQPQSCEFFSDKIGYNLSLSQKSYDQEALHSLLDHVDLTSMGIPKTDFFEHKLISGESFLSGGERQKMALMRLMYQNKPLILTDEIDAALDSKTKNLAYQLLRKYCEKRIMISIIHDLNLLKYFDYILDLSQKAPQQLKQI